MPTPTKGPRLGGGPAHERLLLANLAAALFTHKSIKTTETKAKRLRPVAERMITFAKRGDMHARRRVAGMISDKTVVHELFTEIAPLVADRPGGYTRITKLGFRKGDNASMVQIELVLEPVTPKTKSKPAKAAASKAEPVEAEPVEAESTEAEPAETEATEADVTEVEATETSVQDVAEEALAQADQPAEEGIAAEPEATEVPVEDTVHIDESTALQAKSEAAQNAQPGATNPAIGNN